MSHEFAGTYCGAATFATIIVLALGVCAPVAASDLTLNSAVENPARSAKFVARDKVRHPLDELAFFGVTPQSTVVEIWPGGGYWTEILAPFLQDHGAYYVAMQGKGGSEAADAEADKLNALFHTKLEADKATYGKLTPTGFGIGQGEIAPPGSADFILSFRNLHNWLEGGFAPEAFADFYRALKPGGASRIIAASGTRRRIRRPRTDTSGRLRHRSRREGGFRVRGLLRDQRKPPGYGELAEGVWTLPPTFKVGKQDKAKYEAIGEADNFVLKFRKSTQ
jgi:predicted methyltransferase